MYCPITFSRTSGTVVSRACGPEYGYSSNRRTTVETRSWIFAAYLGAWRYRVTKALLNSSRAVAVHFTTPIVPMPLYCTHFFTCASTSGCVYSIPSASSCSARAIRNRTYRGVHDVAPRRVVAQALDECGAACLADGAVPVSVVIFSHPVLKTVGKREKRRGFRKIKGVNDRKL